jgi:exodeoxyribonuclease-5
VQLNQGQTATIANIRAYRGEAILVGPAGTGKTTVIRNLVEHDTLLLAPTNAAAQVLSSKTGRKVLTVHKAFGLNPKEHDDFELAFELDGVARFGEPVDYVCPAGVGRVIVDEASMIGDKMLAALRRASDNILWVGDPAQLNPVKEEVSPVFKTDCPLFRLTKIERNSDPMWIQIASAIRQGVSIEKVLDMVSPTEMTLDQIAEDCSWGDSIALAYTNTAVNAINTLAHAKLDNSGLPFSPGEKVIAQGPHGLNIYNGQNMVIEAVGMSGRGENYMTVRIDGETYHTPIDYARWRNGLSAAWKQYHDLPRGAEKKALSDKLWGVKKATLELKLGYAMTVHKSQGQTIENVIVLVDDLRRCRNPEEQRRLFYTAHTRASDTTTWATISPES